MKNTWSVTKAAALLAVLWFFAFLVALSVPLIALQRGYIEWSNASIGLTAVSDTFAPHLGLILVYYMSSRIRRSTASNVRPMALVIAFITTVVWNTIILLALLPVLFGMRGIEEADQIITTLGPRLSWFVGPALGFFFASHSQAKAD